MVSMKQDTRNHLCSILEWDTKFFGFRIAKVDVKDLTEETSVSIDRWCEENRIRCLYFLTDINNQESIIMAGVNDYLMVDVRLTYELENALYPSNSVTGVENHFSHRDAALDDVSELEEIAACSFSATRFYSDPHFSDKQSSSLYETWIKKSVKGYSDKVLIASVDEHIAGFITCDLDESDNTGKIGLVAVAPEFRGQKVGERLVNHACDWFIRNRASRIQVVTQGRNIAAQRLYQKCGFLIRVSQFWFHKWFSFE